MQKYFLTVFLFLFMFCTSLYSSQNAADPNVPSWGRNFPIILWNLSKKVGGTLKDILLDLDYHLRSSQIDNDYSVRRDFIQQSFSNDAGRIWTGFQVFSDNFRKIYDGE